MRRRPYSLPKIDVSSEVPEVAPLPAGKWPKWLTAKQAAEYLGKFRRKDGAPSEGAIRNMIYRKQLKARKFIGRILIDRLELDSLIKLSPQLGGI